MLRKMLGGIVIYSFIIYIVVEFGPQYDFFAITLDPANTLRSTPFFLFIGGIFWLLYDIIRRVVKVITIPLNWISFGLIHVLVNIGVIYSFGALVNAINIGIHVTMGSVMEIILFSFLLGIVGIFIKYL